MSACGGRTEAPTEPFDGGGAFGRLALCFIERSPPRSPVLLGYGDGFPEFLGGLSATPSARFTTSRPPCTS